MGDLNCVVLYKYVSLIERFDLSYKRVDMLVFTGCQSQLVLNHFMSATVCQSTLSLNSDAGVHSEEDQSVETCQRSRPCVVQPVLSAAQFYNQDLVHVLQSLLAKRHSIIFYAARLSFDSLTLSNEKDTDWQIQRSLHIHCSDHLMTMRVALHWSWLKVWCVSMSLFRPGMIKCFCDPNTWTLLFTCVPIMHLQLTTCVQIFFLHHAQLLCSHFY